MANRSELLKRLKELNPAQFEKVLFRLNVARAIIPSLFAEQSIRAIRIIQRLEQEQEGLERLEKTLAEPAISIRKCYALLGFMLAHPTINLAQTPPQPLP